MIDEQVSYTCVTRPVPISSLTSWVTRVTVDGATTKKAMCMYVCGVSV